VVADRQGQEAVGLVAEVDVEVAADNGLPRSAAGYAETVVAVVGDDLEAVRIVLVAHDPVAGTAVGEGVNPGGG